LALLLTLHLNNFPVMAMNCTAGTPTPDPAEFSTAPARTGLEGVLCWKGTVSSTEVKSTALPVIGYCHTDLTKPKLLQVPAGATSSSLLLSTRYTTIDTDGAGPPGDPVSSAEFELAAAMHDGVDTLWQMHTNQLALLNGARINIQGDMALSRVVNASRYALLSTVRADTTYSSSPGGLATNAYNGHAFWDVETWMWPSWLAFHPDIAKAALQYRVNRQPEARANAAAHGFDGLMFPWVR
jgi:hypothetical protein